MPKTKRFGFCHLCLKYKKLSFEHFPPKSCFNDCKVVYDKKILQHGLGEYTLCEECNKYAGANYVGDFKKAVLCAHLAIESGFIRNAGKDDNVLEMKIRDFNPLYFAKQALAIICSVMPTPTLEKYDFSELLTNKSSNLSGKKCEFSLLIGLREDKRYCYINRGPFLVGAGEVLFSMRNFIHYPFEIVFIERANTIVQNCMPITSLLYLNDNRENEFILKVGLPKGNIIKSISNAIISM